MQGINAIFYVVVLIMSVVVHEVSHGFAAEAQGDPTARYAGRLSLNPVSHIDPIGSVILPLLCVVSHVGFIIGWAKPVPYNERNLRSKRWGTLMVAGAGILANACLALVFGIAIRFAYILGPYASAFISIASVIAMINILLALFNLIPIPPLDGSKILFSLLPQRATKFQVALEYLSIPLLLVLLFVFRDQISPALDYLFVHLTGVSAPF